MGEIRENQKTKLLFKTEDGSEKELDCSVKKFDKDRISLNYPYDAMDYVDYLQEGDEVTVKIFTPLGVRIFDAVVLDSPLEPEFVVEYVENSTNIQRRSYPRINLKTKVIIEREENDNIVTHTIDISGGGIRFFYEGKIYPGEEVGVLLYLPYMIRSVQAIGVIMKNDNLPKNEYVLLFTEISERERDKIIKQCFEIQTTKNPVIREDEQI